MITSRFAKAFRARRAAARYLRTCRPKRCSGPPVGRGAPRERPKRLNFPAIIDTRKVRFLTVSGGAYQAAARGPDPAHAAAPGGAEHPDPARVRRRDHV